MFAQLDVNDPFLRINVLTLNLFLNRLTFILIPQVKPFHVN